MYKNKNIAVVVPAYNEEKLIAKTIFNVPNFVDTIVVVNDASTDDTLGELRKIKNNPRLHIINSKKNGGVGYSIKQGLRSEIITETDYVAIMAGDAQMDPNYLSLLLDEAIDGHYDYVKANRFKHTDALKTMPKYRKIGNIVVTILTKFATGYYSIFDTQNGYAVYANHVIKELPFDLLSDRYDYENTVLIGLSIIGARVKDVAVPAVYGEEKSTIKLFSTVFRTLISLYKGFWLRVYYKYILYNFHPIALLLMGGLFATITGVIVGSILTIEKISNGISPSSGTIMLAVLPIIIGFQLLLTALIMDVNNEEK